MNRYRGRLLFVNDGKTAWFKDVAITELNRNLKEMLEERTGRRQKESKVKRVREGKEKIRGLFYGWGFMLP